MPRSGIDSAWTTALAQQGIQTGILIWCDFRDDPIGVWTGSNAITIAGSGDPLLDGKTFEALSDSGLISVGDNKFSYSGSEAFAIGLNLPASPPDALVLSSADPAEYQTRTAVVWRALMITPPGSTTPAVWRFRRVRAGAMDELNISNDGSQHSFSLTIEAHASMISNATASTYLDQKTRYDPNDTSQDFAVSIANNPKNPGSGTLGGGGGRGGIGGGLGGGGGFLEGGDDLGTRMRQMGV